MEIIAKLDAIHHAMDYVNGEFDENIEFNRLERTERKRQESYTVTLTVIDSKKAGSRISANSTRRVHAACWHVHGTFHDALPEGTDIIVSAGSGRATKNPGDCWENWNIGSIAQPCMYSDACDCEN